VKNFIKNLILLSFLFLSACATQLPVANGIKEISTSDYQSLAQSKTEKVEVYNGLYNQLTVSATRIDGEMTDAFLSHSARLLQWTTAQYQTEKAKLISQGAEKTNFFISFYTPERKHDDLSSSKSIWKIYLDINGQRYEGKAVKMKSQLTEVETMYPAHNRWSTPYTVTFPVAAAIADGKPAVITFTGTLTSAQLKFK
jgi:hypothetical protein